MISIDTIYATSGKDKDDASFYYEKGDDLLDNGKYEEAIAEYDKALEIDPEDDVSHFSQGFALFNLGRYEEAIAAYDKALEIDPDYRKALENKEKAVSLLEGSSEDTDLKEVKLNTDIEKKTIDIGTDSPFSSSYMSQESPSSSNNDDNNNNYQIISENADKTYFDPEGKFKLEYPSNWEILPSTNDFYKVMIGKPNPSPSDLTILSIGIKENMPPSATIENLVDSLIQNRQQKMPSYNVVEGPDCETFIVSGQKACHFFETGESVSSFNPEASALSVMSLIDGNLYMISYATNKSLPPSTMDYDYTQGTRIISTFKVTEN